MPTPYTKRLRVLCLALPETSEKIAWGDPTWRVRDKIFAMEKQGGGAEGVWCKAGPGVQEILLDAAAERYFRPPYLGHKGWIGIRLDEALDWDELAGRIADSYRLIAPEKLRDMIG